MTANTKHGQYLAEVAKRREAEAVATAIRNDMPRSGGQAERMHLEQALDDIERYSRLRDYAETRLVSWGPYGPERRGSFLRDLGGAHLGGGPDTDAMARLAEHDELFGPARRSLDTAALGALIPQVVAQDQASGKPFSGRLFTDALDSVPFPEAGMQFSVPVSTTQGTVAFSQTSQNTALGSSDPQYVNRSVTVSTVAVSVQLSRQAFERMGPASEAHLLKVVRQSLDHELERQVFAGSAAHELVGLINQGTVVQANTATGVSIAARTLEGSRLVGDAMLAPATLVGLAPRRWDWLSFQASVTLSTVSSSVRSPTSGATG